jgi:hypothetical protein
MPITFTGVLAVVFSARLVPADNARQVLGPILRISFGRNVRAILNYKFIKMEFW